jgi:hypothetical protein
MSRRRIGRVTAALALAMLVPACHDAPSAPSASGQEMVVISVADIGADAAGIVFRLSGGVEQVEAARASLHVAWAADDATTATVAVLGPIAELNEILIVRRRAGLPALGVQLIDVTNGDGILSFPAAARVVVAGGT